MKRLLLLFTLLLFFFTLIAQVPLSFKYQAVARETSGNVLANKSVTFKINILQGSATGLNIYNELHAVTTNTFGLVELNIGQGTSPSSVFANINWGASTYFVKVELDPLGGVTFYHMGTSQLLSVPYALLARSVQDLPDNIVTNSKIANNAVTINKLPAGATATTFLRGDGTWQVPPSIATVPAGNDGSIQFNYRGNFSYSQFLHWDHANSRLGVGNNTPDAKVQIYTASTTTFPQLKLYESNSSGYARMAFQNSSGSTFWALTALNSATNANERFNLYNSTAGTVMSFSGEGHAGLGSDPYTTVKFFVKDNGNVYGGVFENNGSYTTLQARNYGTGPAGNFISSSSTYTLYAQNLSTGPAAYIDGTLQVAGGNTSEINRSQTGTANIVPVCYGSVEANGTKNSSGSTANFSVIRLSAGVYEITLTSESYSQATHCAIASLGDPGFINTNEVTGKLRINTYSTNYTANDREFSFVVFRP